MVVCGGLWWFAVFQRTVSLARQLVFYRAFRSSQLHFRSTSKKCSERDLVFIKFNFSHRIMVFH